MPLICIEDRMSQFCPRTNFVADFIVLFLIADLSLPSSTDFNIIHTIHVDVQFRDIFGRVSSRVLAPLSSISFHMDDVFN
jgi:hypothetical protein